MAFEKSPDPAPRSVDSLTSVNYLLGMTAPDATVSTTRAFNRFYTRVIGVLGESHLGSGLTLGQCRVLFEIGQLAPVEARALRAHLGLDAGYLSRCLAQLERRGLIARARGIGDARVKRIGLSAKGARKVAMLDRASDATAHTLIDRLDPDQRRRLQQAMLEVQRLLDDPLDISVARADSAEARACLNAYFAELGRRFVGGFDAGPGAAAEVRELQPPHGQLLLLRCGGRPRGCAGIKLLGDGIGEIKRMWIHPEQRGRGAGRTLLAALEEHARSLQLHTLRLDTNAQLGEALALYRSSGYQEIAPYNDNPYATHWFEKRLAAARHRRARSSGRGAGVAGAATPSR